MAMPRKRPLVDPNQYYAYVWRLDGEVLWVGQGKNNRGRPTCRASWSGRPESLIQVLKERANDIDWEVIACSSKAESEDVERWLIKEVKPRFNTAPQKGGWKGMHSAEGLDNIRRAQQGRVLSEEECLVRSRRMKGNKNLFGHKHTEVTKTRISESLIGRQPSELCKLKASERMAARNVTNPPRKGKPCSPEHRRKLSEAAKRRKSHAS